MNKNKISKELLEKVSILNKTSEKILIYSKNYGKTKYFLEQNKYFFKSFRFNSCFSLNADYDDLNIISNCDDVDFIYPVRPVEIEKNEQNFMNLSALTQGKFFGQGQTICFIDTGLHPHLDFLLPKSRIVKFIDLINNSDQPYDDNGHGTFVTGIACGNGIFDKSNLGFAKQANIISIKALDKTGTSDSNKILDAMEWVYQNHKAYNIKVVCMSFGANTMDSSDPLSSGAQALWRRGITVVVAAGNSGPNRKTIKSPGCNPFVITVGGLDVEKNMVADFSSRGPTIYGHKPDLLAPAVNITSCSNRFIPYTNMSGTSVATPIVAGICACLYSKYPDIGNNEIKKFLISHCKKLTGIVDEEGAGILKF